MSLADFILLSIAAGEIVDRLWHIKYIYFDASLTVAKLFKPVPFFVILVFPARRTDICKRFRFPVGKVQAHRSSGIDLTGLFARLT
jgi:hypothetical protein